MEKPKIGMYWCASCGGCEEAVVDLAEFILPLSEMVDIVFWPVALDFKRSDVEAMKDGEMLAVFINGAIALSEQEEMVKMLREKAQLVIAFGACAHMGGIPGLANIQSRTEIFDYYFRSGPIVSNPERTLPDPKVTREAFGFSLPEFFEDVRALDQVIPVDYYVPGCAPTPPVVKNALLTLLSGKLPPKGSVLGSDRALCHECALNATKPDEGMKIKKFYRHHLAGEIDPEVCLLTQGLVCLGPVTRGGCDAMCIKGGMPCTGCFGPMDGVKDFGATALSYIASLIDATDPDEIQAIIDSGIPDPIGTFYMYSLPKSLLYHRLDLPEIREREKAEA
jgi:F420-non-reducing hydrogenase small subunit